MRGPDPISARALLRMHSAALLLEFCTYLQTRSVFFLDCMRFVRAPDRRADIRAFRDTAPRASGEKLKKNKLKKKPFFFGLSKRKGNVSELLESSWKSSNSDSQPELYGLKWWRKFRKHFMHRRAILHTMLHLHHANFHFSQS